MIVSKTETKTVTGPSEWACYLVSGDFSYFDRLAWRGDPGRAEAEVIAMEQWLEAVEADGWEVADIVDDSERFTWRYRMWGGLADGGTVCDYTVTRTIV